ncbi:hypothetical protein RJ639_033134 [Escallonia herrerae]|uniref:Retrotransposon gag domain-containing protein n=1 Tax=Escallonia herrerae TaxID=1293975 RepID=A0AA89B800_9ASTE|nr:hypothetical protein RJ639_033134 [Escallonia herrerae]
MLEAVAPVTSTNPPHLDPSDLRLRLTSRSNYGRRYSSEANPTYQPKQGTMKHVTRSGSCFLRVMSMEGSTNSSPVSDGEVQGRFYTDQRRRPRGRAHGYPLSKTIEKAKLPLNFWMLQCNLYDGRGDPGEHVYQFQTNMLLLLVSNAVMCRAFPSTLRKATHTWFKSLRPRSIHSFSQLTDLFQNHFVSSKTRRKNYVSLLNVVQERNESLTHYLGRFNAATLKIDNLDELVKYTAFLRGLRPTTKFAFAVNKTPPGNMSALLNKANKYIQAEKYLETHKGNRGDNGQEPGKRT